MVGDREGSRDEIDEEWAITLVEQEGVLVQPGYFYDFPATAASSSAPPRRERFAEARLGSAEDGDGLRVRPCSRRVDVTVYRRPAR